MATTIKIKNSATPSSTPSSLEQGEMALNVTDGRLFYGSGSGNDVKEFTGTTIDTGSFATTSSFNTFTSSYYTDSASFDTRINNISIDTSSLVTTSSFNAFTSSIYTFTSSIQTEVDNLTAQTGSYATTGSNTFIGDQIITGSVEITGAITASVVSASYIDLDVLANGDIPAHKAGRIFFGAEDGALEVYNEEADITLQVGQEFWVRVYNLSGAPILNGTPVYASGSQGDRIGIYPALAEDHTTGVHYDNHILGVATHDIGISEEGYVTAQGIVRGIDTSTFTAGDILYLQTGSAGFRNTPPPFPYDIVQVGYVARSASPNGFVFVEPKEPVHFNNISGLSGSASEPGDLWIYQSNNAWSPGKTLSGSYVIDNGNLNIQGNITASAITSSGQIYGQVGVNEYNTSNLPSSFTYSGDVIKLLSVSGLSTQRVYYLNNTTWAIAQSNAESTSDNMLAIAIGSNSDQGMLLRGLYRFSYNPGGNPGDPLYLSLTGGTVTSTAPSGTGEVVRIIGYKVDTNTIYFNPSNDYIVLA
jgi:hypothetical protein